MRTRMAVGRCCCEFVPPPETILPQLAGLIWHDTGDDLDPVQYQNVDATSEPLTSTNYLLPSLDYRNEGAVLVIPHVQGATYTNFQVRFSGIRGATEELSQFELYVLDDPARGVMDPFTPDPIALADLLGPITWDQSAVNWGTIGAGVTRHTTPNLASIVNPVVTDGAWVDDTSCLWLAFKVYSPSTPQTYPYTKTRLIYFDGLNSATWVELITS